MQVWKGLFIALAVGSLLAPHAAAARTVTATYEVAFQNLSGSVADPAGVTADGTIDYGGVILNALAGETSVTISITDASGTAPYFVICQDVDMNSICGETAKGELRADGCGGGTFSLAGTAGQIRVFVGVQNAVAPSVAQLNAVPLPCGLGAVPGVGTTGTVTATFS